MATIDEITNPKGKKVFRVHVRMKGYPAQTATFDRKADARIWAQQTEMASPLLLHELLLKKRYRNDGFHKNTYLLFYYLLTNQMYIRVI